MFTSLYALVNLYTLCPVPFQMCVYMCVNSKTTKKKLGRSDGHTRLGRNLWLGSGFFQFFYYKILVLTRIIGGMCLKGRSFACPLCSDGAVGMP